MKALIIGAGGQLGQSLMRTIPSDCSAVAPPEQELDLSSRSHVERAIATVHPDAVINTAAYTAVDLAETNREAAFSINADAVGALAEICATAGVRLIHVSTDYVFDGESSVAYATNAAMNPINVYGASKLVGEKRLSATPQLRWTLVRTAWVYAPWGRNFVFTMLKLFRERGGASVVADQIGAPTSALNLARFIWRAVQTEKVGVFHYTDAGVASWYDFAVAINEDAQRLGLLTQPARVKPITTAEYPTPAKRPRFSLLATRSSIEAMQFAQPHWREALREVLKEIKT
ncbi:MAG TPA: dTDP-4-dehydrorhamnose reductase [Steroidobacteraceae bacterium]|nr:dTDP-4-dehydrorhamnose reductase [Steroidobacteraceae bacterium]